MTDAQGQPSVNLHIIQAAILPPHRCLTPLTAMAAWPVSTCSSAWQLRPWRPLTFPPSPVEGEGQQITSA